MTEQEAESLVARLTRIWEPEVIKWDLAPSPPRAGIEGVLYLHANLPYSLDLKVDGYLRGLNFCLDTKEGDQGFVFNEQGKLDQSPFLWAESPEKALLQNQFTAQWMPFFRRGCWLSGCPIEATAHEKAEWIQGFSCEEIEAWNLKF